MIKNGYNTWPRQVTLSGQYKLKILGVSVRDFVQKALSIKSSNYLFDSFIQALFRCI